MHDVGCEPVGVHTCLQFGGCAQVDLAEGLLKGLRLGGCYQMVPPGLHLGGACPRRMPQPDRRIGWNRLLAGRRVEQVAAGRHPGQAPGSAGVERPDQPASQPSGDGMPKVERLPVAERPEPVLCEELFEPVAFPR